MAVQPNKSAYLHFGRGGAGNLVNTTTEDKQDPSSFAESMSSSVPPQPGQVTGRRRFSTGIGGTGNMSSLKKLQQDQEADAKMRRELYDRSAPGIMLVEGGHHTGRGGFANRYHPTDEEIQEAKSNNEHVRRQSLAGMAERRKSSLAGKSSLPSPTVEEEGTGSSRRKSSVAGLKDFVMGMGRRGSKV